MSTKLVAYVALSISLPLIYAYSATDKYVKSLAPNTGKKISIVIECSQRYKFNDKNASSSTVLLGIVIYGLYVSCTDKIYNNPS